MRIIFHEAWQFWWAKMKGQGKIVKKDWIEQCHSKRKKFPWRRFCLDNNDKGTESEEEIWDETMIPSTSQ